MHKLSTFLSLNKTYNLFLSASAISSFRFYSKSNSFQVLNNIHNFDSLFNKSTTSFAQFNKADVVRSSYSTKQDDNITNDSGNSTSENQQPASSNEHNLDKKDKPASLNEIKEKDKQIAELKNLYLRTLADQENLVKRTKKQIEDIKSYSLQKFIQDILSTLDVLEIAINSVKDTENNNKQLKDLHEGVTMTYKGLLQTFKKYGIEKIEPLDQEFDPNLHEAVYQAKIDGKKSGIVIKVEKVGYTLNGRVIRPAQVGVAKED